MSERNCRYIPMDNLKDGSTHLEITVSYSRDSSPRGYYITVTPVRKENNSVRVILFTSRRALIARTNRYSDKQFIAALENSKALEKELVEMVLSEQKAA